MNPKNILIDGFNLGLEHGTGVATYARNLSYCARDLGYRVNVLYNRSMPSKNRLLKEVAFFDPAEPPSPNWLVQLRRGADIARLGMGVTAKPVPVTGNVIYTTYQSRMPYFDTIWNYADVFGRADRHFYLSRFLSPMRLRVKLNGVKPDIAHWTYPLPMFVPGTKNIYTLHDLVPLRLPYTTLDRKRHYFRLMQTLARKADHIITVSETSRRDIINLLGVKEHQVTNTYQSVEIPEKYASKSNDLVQREVEGTFNLKYKGYLLFFGAIEPKKNVGRLIEGYLASGVEIPLVIVGKRAWKSEQELRLLNDESTSYLEQLGSLTYRRRRVFHVDYAPFPLLVSLIRGARAVVFPSLYEGFGLPVLEAMKLGTPVLTSSTGALAEVAGDAALLVNPYDTREIAEGIAALAQNDELRGDLAAKGVARASLFSKQAYTRRLEEVYDRVLAKKNSRVAAETPGLLSGV